MCVRNGWPPSPRTTNTWPSTRAPRCQRITCWVAPRNSAKMCSKSGRNATSKRSSRRRSSRACVYGCVNEIQQPFLVCVSVEVVICLVFVCSSIRFVNERTDVRSRHPPLRCTHNSDHATCKRNPLRHTPHIPHSINWTNERTNENPPCPNSTTAHTTPAHHTPPRAHTNTYYKRRCVRLWWMQQHSHTTHHQRGWRSGQAGDNHQK